MNVLDYLGDHAQDLLDHRCEAIETSLLHLPGPDFIDRVASQSDRSPAVLRNLAAIFRSGRLANTGYLSILPVDQGIEHSAGASFAKNPAYFDPAGIVELAHEGGCNAVASTLGVLAAVSRTWAHRIPFLVKLNHNELLTYPNGYAQQRFASVRQAFEMGAAAVGATIYFGSQDSRREITEVADLFEEAHSLGLVTVLWCYLRNSAFKMDRDHHSSADLTGQANHIGVTLKADIIKQKMATHSGGYVALNLGDSSYGKFDERIYTELTRAAPDGSNAHPIDLVRYQVLNCFAGRSPMLNSGGASGGKSDFEAAVRTAVINKRAGGVGLISGRKAFQRPMREGVKLLNLIQDVYLDPVITVA
jgi:class I fructose-bisphosphate aldolase